MNQRWLSFRIMALLLAVSWAALGAWLLIGYGDVEGAGWTVIAWPFLPAVVAFAAVLPSRRQAAPTSAVVGIGVLALLLAAGFAITLWEPTGVAGRAPHSGSPLVGYGGALAIGVTTLFAAAGWLPGEGTSRRAVPAALVAGLVGGGVLVVPGSGAVAAGCGALVADGASAEVVAEAAVDSRQLAVTTLGAASPESTDATASLTALLLDVAGPEVEDRGIDVIAGTHLRHCRRTVSGEQALRAFPALGLLVDRPLAASTSILAVWRGELDWWHDAAGRPLVAIVSVGGLASDFWPDTGVRGLLRAELRVRAVGGAHRAGQPLP